MWSHQRAFQWTSTTSSGTTALAIMRKGFSQIGRKLLFFLMQRHPDEKLSDKQFNEKYRGPIKKLFEISDEGESPDEDEDNDGDNDSIDLEATSEGEDNEEEPEFYGPGEYSHEDDDFSPEEGEEIKGVSEGGVVEHTQNEGMEGIEI
ncbi:hypothetical protein O181_077298 [Austropuccinia psidii MF-1]|uniref:Uncharacterized protein n=1 Tax=Austropuccinia psidii MF-1 TaxID=1389203 RepID=A0A9Q3FGP0_9BASI|nr:hypothetical protein [Austropuccinia psidii MF-1]